MFMVFVVGPAGSGKTTLVHSFASWLEQNQYDVTIVNLDPAAEHLPYIADIDVRDVASARKIARKYGLGPNASIIAAIDLVNLNADRIKQQIIDVGGTYVLVDTPGQMELFAFRGSSALLISRLSVERSAIVFVMDSTAARTPMEFVSSLLLAMSTQLRFNKPQVNVLNKIDMVDPETVERMLSWIEEPEGLVSALRDQIGSSVNKLELDLCLRIAELIASTEQSLKVIPISAKTGQGLDDLYRELHNIYVGGQDYDYVD